MTNKIITALAGGVGGAKLVYGFSKILEIQDFNVIVNTGDDFSYYGLPFPQILIQLFILLLKSQIQSMVLEEKKTVLRYSTHLKI